MILYNINYGSQQLNTFPITKENINRIMKEKYVHKKINNELKKIPTSMITVTKCIIM